MKTKPALPWPWPQNRICDLFHIEHPIVQAGMVYMSGAKLAAAAANAGCLGLLGAGSMNVDLLREHIRKAKSLTEKPFGVNLPLLYSAAKEQIDVCLAEGVKIFFTSAGSPKLYTEAIKKQGGTVVHVTSSVELALKCQAAGVDAVVLEGFEAGGHNGRDETTTLVLLQQAMGKLNIPVIAAGGIGTGAAIASAFAFGCDGVQVGTRFAATVESSGHEKFKQALVEAGNGSTFLCMRKAVPVRLLINDFANEIRALENSGADVEKLEALLGKGRARKGMLEGDLTQGELEIGQVVSEVKSIQTVAELVNELREGYRIAIARLCSGFTSQEKTPTLKVFD